MDKVVEEVQAVRYTIKKFLELIRENFDADVCYLYLVNTEMDIYERRRYLIERVNDIKEAYDNSDEDYPEELECYDSICSPFEAFEDNHYKIMKTISVLKFIDVAKKNGVAGWEFSYDNRPKKYIIFKDVEKNKIILKEGLTAYIARVGETLVFKTHDEVAGHRSSAFLNSSNGIIESQCHMMIGFPLIDGEGRTIGVLKVENYREGTYSYEKGIKATSKYLPLLIQLIESSESSFRTNSYKELFRGIGLLDNLKRLKPSEKTNKYIHEATLHLFLVLERNEYIGYDEILKRITYYVNEISEHLDIKGEMIESFNNYLEKFRKHEELLLSGLNDYRDHFMHQFHVFVSGYIIMNEFGIDTFRSYVEKSFRYTLGLKDDDIRKNGSDVIVSESDVLKIWFLTAFYHDYAYILEKIDMELEKFFKDVLGYPFSVKFNWEQLLKKESEFPIHLSNLLNFFSSPKGTNPETLLRNYLNAIIESHDHGVLSALLLIHNAREETQKNINECLYAALAISLHNRAVYEDLTERNIRRIAFESFPIAFLLAFCDTAQSFGRLEMKDSKESSAYPVGFLDIEVARNDKVIYRLNYICDNPTKIPTGDKIEQWANDIHNVFKSEKYTFEIEYYKGIDNRLIRTLSF